MDGCERWMDGCDRPSEIDRTNDALRSTDAMRSTRSNDRRPRDRRGTDAHPREAPTGGFYFYDGRTVGRTARERFENVILSDRSKPFARVGIYIRLMYGMYAPRALLRCFHFNPKKP